MWLCLITLSGTCETAIHFVIYEHFKKLLRENNGGELSPLECTGAAGVAKFTASILCYPHGKDNLVVVDATGFVIYAAFVINTGGSRVYPLVVILSLTSNLCCAISCSDLYTPWNELMPGGQLVDHVLFPATILIFNFPLPSPQRCVEQDYVRRYPETSASTTHSSRPS
jgi:hypothetical protein